MTRRAFLASLPLCAALARAVAQEPARRNVKWALSAALWRRRPEPFSDILDVMKETGFVGLRLADFPGILERYGMTGSRLHAEISRRGLEVASISWHGELLDGTQRQKTLQSARDAMKFLADFGANHLVVFPPGRIAKKSDPDAAFSELAARCNQIGEIAGEMGFTAGLHNHMDTMVQTQEEVDRFMSLTDPRLFGLSPDTAHLDLGGCDVVGTFGRYRHRIHFMDYKDARWTAPAHDWVEPNRKVLPGDSAAARFYASIYDLGDGEIDFPGCHRVLKSVAYRGWICVDLDTVRNGPLASYTRCRSYITRRLEPIYA